MTLLNLFEDTDKKPKFTVNDIGINPIFNTDYGCMFEEDSRNLMKQLPDNFVDMIFADPPYNINKADWDNFKTQEEYVKWSEEWIREASRILKPSGTLFVCGFSEILADIKLPAMRYFMSCRWLIWHYKNKANLGTDWGRSHESIIAFRKSKKYKINIDLIRVPYNSHTLKYPIHPQADTSQYSNLKTGKKIWQPHPLGAKPKDVGSEDIEKLSSIFNILYPYVNKINRFF